MVTAKPHNSATAEVLFLPGLVDGSGNFAGFGAPVLLATVGQTSQTTLIVDGDFQGNGITDLAVGNVGGVTIIYGTPLSQTPITTPATARDLGDAPHLATQPQAIVPGHTDAYFAYTVPTEAAADSGPEVVDISALFQDTTGSGLSLSVTLADGTPVPILQSFADPTSGSRYRVLAPQGAELLIHVADGGDPNSFGLYTLDIDLLPQIVAAQAESALPGDADTSIVLTLQGGQLDSAAAENPANYIVFQLDANGNPTGTLIPLSSAPGLAAGRLRRQRQSPGRHQPVLPDRGSANDHARFRSTADHRPLPTCRVGPRDPECSAQFARKTQAARRSDRLFEPSHRDGLGGSGAPCRASRSR